MNDILINLATMLLNNYAPLIISGLTGWIAVKFNAFLNTKHDQLKAVIKNDAVNQTVTDAFNKIQLSKDTLDFINAKALDGLHLAEEKAFQSWKDNTTKEITGTEKKDIAVDFVEQAVKTITDNKDVMALIPSVVEKALVTNRSSLDSIFNTLKQNFVLLTGSVPANSKDPFATPAPNTIPTK